jgi:hypothetical protein
MIVKYPKNRLFISNILLSMPDRWLEVTEEWRKLRSGELRNLYSYPNIVRQIKSWRMRWAGHGTRMGEGRNVYKVLMEKPEVK